MDFKLVDKWKNELKKFSSGERWLVVGLGCLSGVLLMWMLELNLSLLPINQPLEYREDASVLSTELILQGMNPYSWAAMPVYVNVYGWLFNYLVVPVTWITGPGYLAHRLVAMVFWLASIGLLSAVLVKRKVPLTLILIPGALWYFQLMMKQNYIGKSDSLGVFLFLVGALIPWWRKFSYKSLSVAVGFSILAFIAKPYFLLLVLYLVVYVFLFVSKKKALVLGGGAVVVVAAAFGLMDRVFETYFFNVLAIHKAATNLSWLRLWDQSVVYISWNFGVLLVAGPLIINEIKRGVKKIRVDWQHGQQPLVAKKFSYLTFLTLVSVGVIVTSMGRHTGGNVSYYLHLVSPFLYLLVFSRLVKLTVIRRKRALMLVGLNLVVIMLQVVMLPKIDVQRAQWQEWNEFLAVKKQVLTTPLFAYLSYRQGKEVYNTGQTEFYKAGLVVAEDWGMSQRLRERYEDVVVEVNNRIVSQKYGALVLAEEPPFVDINLLKEYYRVVDQREIVLFNGKTYTAQVWEAR